MLHVDVGIFSNYTVDGIIGIVSLIVVGLVNIDRFRKLAALLQLIILLLRMYKHLAPMAKHYFDTHPIGRALRRKTNIDNQITTLIKSQRLPYDGKARHEELKKLGAGG